MLLPVDAPPVWIHMSGSALIPTAADPSLPYAPKAARVAPPSQNLPCFLVGLLPHWLRLRVTSHGFFRCSGRVNFTGDAPPYGFRRQTQESAVAATVALFERNNERGAVQVDATACSVLMQVLARADASALLPNFVEAEFNDNDGALRITRNNHCPFNGVPVSLISSMLRQVLTCLTQLAVKLLQERQLKLLGLNPQQTAAFLAAAAAV